MLTEAQILGLLNGTLPPEERARVAGELAREPEAARRVFGAKRLDALVCLLGAGTSAPPPASASPPAESPAPPPEPSPDEALRQVLLQVGHNGWAYRPEKEPTAPGGFTVLGRALQEWSCTWHARVLLLGIALGLAFMAFSLLKDDPQLKQWQGSHQLPGVGGPASGAATGPPPATPAPAPGNRRP